ncbi:MAG: RIP metalloprotease RseP [Acidimicrobiaceae bacterium]|nr:RIP metalloprotease RseP [Acidimicrobiaceae bacterium]|tara:strand:- start:20436 stop:21827 length:1392 start_codon:yes stop_codon:yes gene_type:complete
MDRDHNFKLLLLFGAFLSLALLGGFSAVVVVLSIVLIFFFHELGHYLVARMSGMQVTEFFIGFGPRIFSFQRGETEYGLKAIPAGAYVRITGMTSLEDVDPAIENRTYRAQTYPKRLAVTLAGSATHFLLAFLLLIVIFITVGRPHPSIWEVGYVMPDSMADEIGVSEGDRILSVGGRQTEDFEIFRQIVMENPQRIVEVEIDREGKLLSRFGVIKERISVQGAAFFEELDFGDQIISIDGTPYSNWTDFAGVLADGSLHQVEVDKPGLGRKVLELGSKQLPDEEIAVRGFFGVSPRSSFQTLSFGESLPASGEEFAEISVASVEGLADFFSPESLTGFVRKTFTEDLKELDQSAESDDNRLLSIYGAARLGSAMLEDGANNFLWFLVLINVFVGIFNLVPLLPLDGGHVAIATYERLRSRKGKRYVADINKLIPVTWIVVTVLVGIGLIALYRDIVDLPNFG